ncbi:methyltransferase domain-containing protein [Sinorhizobium meliloti]|uniref:class I SAM-dependent methyltransferase n=1 Tax=Rhizobium meliloti TaxID=382 RepID=UPI000FD6CB93|nr:class I SAM-dependent methyltransferase [Sinorhizobium meliloti]MDW9581896.1 methyltransferase domain-containing protein [Sinorhizobium meliloti]RVH78541.1 class I SAM-dependent methyltransferase [Sinorhizobium meliloti]
MSVAMHNALLESETRQAKLLFELDWRVDDPSTYILDDVNTPRDRSTKMRAEYYQELHDDNDAYQANNWLVAEKTSILNAKPKTLVEVGCGNGAFSLSAAENVEKVFAVDWALSPKFCDRPENVEFVQADVTQDRLPKADVVCSADVLEHFTPWNVTRVLEHCASAAALQYHVIACYDDGHSHLTVMRPSAWLATFWRFFPDARLKRIDCRRDKHTQLVCVISNIK